MIESGVLGLLHGFSVALQAQNLMWCLLGVLVGNLVGVLPGMGVLSSISILLPLTFGMSPVGALLMLAGIYYGAQYGGAICSILLNLPCHPPHAVTCLDGYPMTQAGRGGVALGITMLAAVIGAAFGIMQMIVLAPFIARIAFQFGPQEICSLMLLGLLAGSTLAKGSPVKGVAMTLLGILLSLVGTDVNTGNERFTFGTLELSDGLELVTVSLGLFGIAEFLRSVNAAAPGPARTVRLGFRDLRPQREDLRRALPPILRGTVIGSLCSLIPGTGPTIASFIAYATEKKISRAPERFGRGAIEGVAAPEASTHSAVQGDFIPTMSLGIPGDAVMALLLGALMIHGIQPGPRLIVEQPDIFWGLIASFWIGNLILVVLNVPMIGVWVRLLQRAVSVPLPGGAVLRVHRRVRRAQRDVRCGRDAGVRRVRVCAAAARVRAGADPARVRAGAAAGGELPALAAAVEGQPGHVRGPADQRRVRRLVRGVDPGAGLRRAPAQQAADRGSGGGVRLTRSPAATGPGCDRWGKRMRTQVLVVGAGPVGLTMAGELARYGLAVRIIDKAAHRTDKSKALVVWSRTLELLDRAGCADAFVAAGWKVRAANIIAGGKPLAHVSFDEVASSYRYALMLPQSETERLLQEHLATLGVTVEREVEAASFTHDDSGVTAVLRNAQGHEETVAADWLIGCDGAHSTVRHGLGLPFEGETLKSDWVLADVHVSNYPFPESEMATYWHQSGVLVLFPILPGRYRVLADLGVAQGRVPADPTLEQVQSLVAERGPPGLVLSDPIWLSGFRINERKVSDYRSGRVFVAGDAAHVHSPAGGQGMNTGMQDAFNLAWKLAMVCRGTGAPGLLDSYSAERSEIGAQVLKAAGRLTAVAVMKNHAAQSVRNLIGRLMLGFAPVRRAVVETMTEVSIGYSDTPLNGRPVSGLAGPEPGERMRPVEGQIAVGAGDVPRFALFAEPNDAAAGLLRDHAGILDPALRPPPAAGGMWLVRPDGYVGCVARRGDGAAMGAYLGAIEAASRHGGSDPLARGQAGPLAAGENIAPSVS